MVIIEPATVASSAREPSGPRVKVHARASSTPPPAAALSKVRVRRESRTAPATITRGTNQKVPRRVSQRLSNRRHVEATSVGCGTGPSSPPAAAATVDGLTARSRSARASLAPTNSTFGMRMSSASGPRVRRRRSPDPDRAASAGTRRPAVSPPPRAWRRNSGGGPEHHAVGKLARGDTPVAQPVHPEHRPGPNHEQEGGYQKYPPWFKYTFRSPNQPKMDCHQPK